MFMALLRRRHRVLGQRTLYFFFGDAAWSAGYVMRIPAVLTLQRINNYKWKDARDDASDATAYLFCYGLALLQNLNANDKIMLPPNARRQVMRHSTRMLPRAMDIEQAPVRAHSKDKYPRDFGTNLSNTLSQPTLPKPSAFLKKPYGRRPAANHPPPHPLALLPLAPEQQSETSPYHQQILSLFLAREQSSHTQHDFLNYQPQIEETMREVLLCWLVEVCNEFRLKNETLFLGVSLIDRYLKSRQTSKNRFQLLGVSALFMAAKCEEIYAPHVDKLVAICGGSCQKQDIFEMESEIFVVLDFRIIGCTADRFLELRWLQIQEDLPEQIKTLAQFLLMLAMTEYRMCWHKPSHLALAALSLSTSVIQKRMVEPRVLAEDVQVDEVRLGYAQLSEIYADREEDRFQCVRLRMAKHRHYDPVLY